MNKAKILSVALVAGLVASVSAVGASAATINSPAEIKDHKVGLIGGFNSWGGDLEMTDADGDGVYEGTISIESVTDDMLAKDADGANVLVDGKTQLQFKVRLDGSWDNSWGEYEAEFDRTENSQTNCSVDATVGEPLTINVKFDTNNVNADALADPNSDAKDMADSDDKLYWLAVTYEVVASSAPVEESKEESSKEESTSAPAEESKEDSTVAPESSDTTTVPTGDTTSAVAVAAVALAALGTAVVMTKKASNKD